MPTERDSRSRIEKPLPQNIQAERSILGVIILNNAAAKTALEVPGFSASDFFLDPHRRIYRCVTEMIAEGRAVDLVTLAEELYKRAQLEAAGGAAYISSLVDGEVRLSNVSEYARIVHEKAVIRRMMHGANSLLQDALDPAATVESLQAKARTLAEQQSAAQAAAGNGHLSYSLADFLTAEFPPPEHLVEGLIPRGSTALIVALPHRMKSWFTTALALGSTTPGIIMGKLEVKKPVRTLLVQVEDFPGQLQWRMRELLRAEGFQSCEPANLRIIPRCGLNLPDENWYQQLLREVEQFKADHVIMDVVRRIFRGDINSPKDTALFLENIDRLREATACAVTLVHHENKKDAEIMTAAAGSYNLPGWANVMIQFKRKTQEGHVTHVEIEVDNKLAPSPEPMRMVLDLTSEMPVRVEALEDGVGVMEARERLAGEWTVRDLAEVLEVHKSNAYRRLKRWIASGQAEKITSGRRGRAGGLARFRFVGDGE